MPQRRRKTKQAPPQDGETPPLQTDADIFYAYCKQRVAAWPNSRPALSALTTPELLCFIAMTLAHAVETAARAFDASLLSTEPLAQTAAILNDLTPERLYELGQAWLVQHPSWPGMVDASTYFLWCRESVELGLHELAERMSQFRVLQARRGLDRPPETREADTRAAKQFFDELQGALQRTVHRSLVSRASWVRMTPEDQEDLKGVAIAGALEDEAARHRELAEFFAQPEATLAAQGTPIEGPDIPKLPVRGMTGTEGAGMLWRALARHVAFEFLQRGVLAASGILERTLPDAAAAAVRAEFDRADAKTRGGSGGRKARKAGTEELPVQHDSLDALLSTPDERPTPQQALEDTQAEAAEHARAEQARRIAVERWGPSGERMLEALAARKSDKEAAKAAGISAPALGKRLKTLEKLLGSRHGELDPPGPPSSP